MFPIKRTVFLCTVTVHKNTVRLIGNIEYVLTKPFSKNTTRSIELVSRGGPLIFRLMLMISRGGPTFWGCMLINSRGEPPFWGYMLMNYWGGLPFWGCMLMNARSGPFLGGCMLMKSRGGPPFGWWILELDPPFWEGLRLKGQFLWIKRYLCVMYFGSKTFEWVGGWLYNFF